MTEESHNNGKKMLSLLALLHILLHPDMSIIQFLISRDLSITSIIHFMCSYLYDTSKKKKHFTLKVSWSYQPGSQKSL